MKMKISGREFFPYYVNIRIEPVNRQIKTIAELSIDLSQNPNFFNVDFKDDIEIYNENNNLIFRGLVKSYTSNERMGFIVAQDYSLKLEIDRLTAAETFSMQPNDIVALFTKSAGITPNFPQGTFNSNERDFIIIAPVQNLKMTQNFKIGNVDFYYTFNGVDDRNISNSDNGRNEPIWRDSTTRAKIIIRANGFYEAITMGYKVISKTIDMISLRTDLSFPSVKINGDKNSLEFDFYEHYSRIKIPDVVYCREANTNARIIYGINSIKESILDLGNSSQIYFSELNDLFNDLAFKNELTEEENNIFQILHWLRKAIQEGNNKDKFIDLWIAFEFIISGTENKKLFTKEEKTRLKEQIDFTSFNTEQRKAIESKINMLNDSPLMEKFKTLLKYIQIDISESELLIIKQSREKRTDIVHGKKDINVTDEELNKMRTFIEKILIAKLNLVYPIKDYFWLPQDKF